MKEVNDRRDFLRYGIAATSAMIATQRVTSAAPGEFSGKIKKAVKYHMVTERLSVEDKFRLLKDVGFDGVETRSAARETAETLRAMAAARDKTGLPVHGIVHSSNPDIKSAIDQAAMLGATSVLHVVRYDQNKPYLQNYRETQDIIRRAIDHAEAKKVHILLENVWATFLIEPMGMARYIDELGSRYVQCYFDVGNVVRWGWPQHWIEVLGKRVVKLDIKEYDLRIAMNEGMRSGFSKPLGEGSIDWAKVRQELKRIDYRGWATAEIKGGDRAWLSDVALRMDRILDMA